MKKSITVLLLLSSMIVNAQITTASLVGDWKCYLNDKISFEFLRLKGDGTGLKCFGQTINGKDTLFVDHVTALVITSWNVDKQRLILNSKNTLSFKIRPEYTLKATDTDKITLTGENLIFYLYPSVLNRKEFYRSVVYQKARCFSKDYSGKASTCISDESLVSFKPLDEGTKLAQYVGFDDLIPHLIACHLGYEFAQQYPDPPYSLVVPTSINELTLGFGNKNFYISLYTDKDSSETSIEVYYDFGDELKKFYFKEYSEGKGKMDVVRKNGLDIYRGTNWQGKYEGKIFLDHSLMVAYYTRDSSLLDKLQNCITSFKYK